MITLNFYLISTKPNIRQLCREEGAAAAVAAAISHLLIIVQSM